jgi:hypothetical protein
VCSAKHCHLPHHLPPWDAGLYRLRYLHGRCSRSVDSLSDGSPKFVAIDEETKHQIVHWCRFGKTSRATHEPLDPGAQIEVFALDGLCVLFTDYVLRRGDMPFVGTPPVGVKARDAKWL